MTWAALRPGTIWVQNLYMYAALLSPVLSVNVLYSNPENAYRQGEQGQERGGFF
jgi:hypothetical protein